MDKFQEAFYVIKEEELMICSFWYPVLDSEIFPLCRLWVYHKGSLFYSDNDILSNSCNTSLILNSFFNKLRQAFKEKSSEFAFYFNVEDENNIGNLELRLLINHHKATYVSVFKATLVKSFRSNPLQEFMQKVSEVCQVKDAAIENYQNELQSFTSLSQRIKTTQDQVKIMREETGAKLAARFMVLLNQIKEKAVCQAAYAQDFETLTQSKKKI